MLLRLAGTAQITARAPGLSVSKARETQSAFAPDVLFLLAAVAALRHVPCSCLFIYLFPFLLHLVFLQAPARASQSAALARRKRGCVPRAWAVEHQSPAEAAPPRWGRRRVQRVPVSLSLLIAVSRARQRGALLLLPLLISSRRGLQL